MLRRIAPDDLPFFTRLHALPEVAQWLYPEGRPRAPEETAAWLRATLAGYEQLALGYLAVLRSADRALRLSGAPADVELTFECELGYTFDPAVWGRGRSPQTARLGSSPPPRRSGSLHAGEGQLLRAMTADEAAG